MNTSFGKRIRNKILNNKPTYLHRFILLLLVFMVALSVSMSDIMYSTQLRVEQLLSAVLPSVVVDLTNTERTERNLSSLTRNSLLDKAAKLKAEHMRDNDYFAHFSPDGISPWYWFDQIGYDYIHAGENLAVFFDDSDEVVQAWMDSPLHRDNILKAEYTEIGVATVKAAHDGYDTVFVVQLFGTPAQTAPIAQAVVPQPQKILAEEPIHALPKETAPITEKQDVQTFEMLTPTVSEVAEEPKPDVVPQPKETVQSKSSIVTEVPIEGKTVYVAPHISTSTISEYIEPQEGQGGGTTVFAFKALLYMSMLIVVVFLLIASILHAQKQRNFVHAFYSISLLVLTIATVTLHTHIVSASSLF